MPKPPSSRGRHTLVQATRQWPPFASFLPLHKNPLLILSIALKLLACCVANNQAWNCLKKCIVNLWFCYRDFSLCWFRNHKQLA
jgi:hypothetical protein